MCAITIYHNTSEKPYKVARATSARRTLLRQG
jgi:hypothetical protein